MKQIKINYDDNPYKVKDGERVEDVTFTAVGSKYGRFIFTDNITLMEIPENVKDVEINRCYFIGNADNSTAIRV